MGEEIKMTNKENLDTLEHEVLANLSESSISEWCKNGNTFTLEKDDGWHISVSNKCVFAPLYVLNMLMIDSTKNNSGVSDGQGYTFEGPKVKKFYEKLDKKYSQHSFETEQNKRVDDSYQILRAFLGK